VGEAFPGAKHQRCTVYFYRNIFSLTPRSKVKPVSQMLKAIHAQESEKATHEKAKAMQDCTIRESSVKAKDTKAH